MMTGMSIAVTIGVYGDEEDDWTCNLCSVSKYTVYVPFEVEDVNTLDTLFRTLHAVGLGVDMMVEQIMWVLNKSVKVIIVIKTDQGARLNLRRLIVNCKTNRPFYSLQQMSGERFKHRCDVILSTDSGVVAAYEYEYFKPGLHVDRLPVSRILGSMTFMETCQFSIEAVKLKVHIWC